MLSLMYPVLVGFVRCSSLSMPKVVEGNSESWCCGAEFWGSYYVPCLGVGFFWNLHASVGRLSEWWKSFVANLLMELADCFFFCFRVGALALAGVRWDVFCVNKVLCYDLVDPLSMSNLCLYMPVDISCTLLWSWVGWPLLVVWVSRVDNREL